MDLTTSDVGESYADKFEDDGRWWATLNNESLLDWKTGNGSLPIWEMGTGMVWTTSNVGGSYADTFEKEEDGSLPIWRTMMVTTRLRQQEDVLRDWNCL